jgi:hypothetical protein
MAMKRTELEKRKAVAIQQQMKKAGAPERFGKGSAEPLSRREQRELERAQGLVPFAVKLDGGLVKRLHQLAQERQVDLGQLVGELRERALDSKG